MKKLEKFILANAEAIARAMVYADMGFIEAYKRNSAKQCEVLMIKEGTI